MIKVEKDSLEIRGTINEVITEIGYLVTRFEATMGDDRERREVRDLIDTSIRLGREFADSQLRTR